MLSRFACCLSAFALALVSPLSAKTVYIPLTGQQLVDTTPLEVRVVISNHGTTPASVKHFFVASGADGTERSGVPPSVDVAAGQTIVLTRPAADRGLFELSGPDTLAYAAHLAAVGEPSRFLALPVITARTVYSGADILYLQALPRGAGPPTDVALVNMGSSEATCATFIYDLEGAPVVAPVTLNKLPPLSNRQIDNVLGSLPIGAPVRIKISCDQPFYAFALVGGQPGAERLSLVTPSSRANFGISHEPEGPAGCPVGATCFDRAGLVHKPTPAAPVKRLSIPVPPGSYRRIHLRIDIKHGGWASGKANGRHHLFWLVRNKNLDMIANGDFYGPNANYLDLQHGIGLVHEAKIHLRKENFIAQPGATYHFDYLYDVEARFLELVVTQGGAQVARLRGVPNVSQFTVGSGDEIILDLGFDGSSPAEPATFNWLYQNVEVDFVP